MNKRVNTLLWSALGCLVVVAAAWGSYYAIAIQPISAQPPVASFPTPGSDAQANAQDLTYLEAYVDLDRSFTSAARKQFLQEIDAAIARPPADRAALEMEVARLAALSGNGHSNALGVSMGHGVAALPLRLGWFRDGLYVLKTAPELVDLLGARVVAVDGKTPQAVLAALTPYIAGNAQLQRMLALNVIVAPAALHAAGIARSATELTFSVQLRDGTTAERTITSAAGPVAHSDTDHWPIRDWSPVAQDGDTRSWRHVLDAIPTPLYLRDPDTNYWRAYPTPDVLYVHIGRVRNQGSQTLRDFLSQTVADFVQRRASHAIVDLRANRGGDYTQTIDFTEALPAALPPEGRVFILIGPGTFSAALVTAARLSYFGAARAVTLGDTLGDRMQAWGEVSSMILPSSRLKVQYSTAYHDWQHGCRWRDVWRCYPANWRYAVPAGDMEPTVRVVPDFAQYAAGRDMVMEEALRLTAPATTTGE